MGYKDLVFPEGSLFLVTGGAGFIGSNLCEAILKLGYRVRCLDDLSTGKQANVDIFIDNPNYTFIKGDIKDLDTCLRAADGVDYVMNEAAWGSVPRSIEMPLFYCANNIQGTLNSVLKSVLHKDYLCGHRFSKDDLTKHGNDTAKKKSKRRYPNLQILYVMRALLWKTGRWKNKSLTDFINDIKPDLLFLPLYSHENMLYLAKYLQDTCGVPSTCYMADDGYTLRQLNFSPLYWLRRFNQRKLHKRIIERCHTLYVISQYQKEEYDKIFGNKCKVLCKHIDFSGIMPEYSSHDLLKPIRFIYAGNIGSGRIDTLLLLADGIEKFNLQHGNSAELVIYSGSAVSVHIQKKIERYKCVRFMGLVSSEQVLDEYKKADYLVHVESFSHKYKCQVRLSFSTKIIDYIITAKPIFAIGPANVASMQYLLKEKIALVCCGNRECNYLFCYKNPDYKNDGVTVALMNLSFVGMLIQLLAPLLGEFFRISMYFSISNCLMFPYIVSRYVRGDNKITIFLSSTAVFIAYSIYYSWNLIISFSFI